MSENQMVESRQAALERAKGRAPVSRIEFVNANLALVGATPPSELRRGNVEAVKRAARVYGEQVAV